MQELFFQHVFRIITPMNESRLSRLFIVCIERHIPVKNYLKIPQDSLNPPWISGQPENCSHRVGSMNCPITPPLPNFTLVPVSWQPPNPGIILSDVEAWFVTPENSSPLLKYSVTSCIKPLYFIHLCRWKWLENPNSMIWMVEWILLEI